MTFESPWWELRGGFITGDVVMWRDPVWSKGRKKGERGAGFGGEQIRCVGQRVIGARVISGPSEDGWYMLEVVQYDNRGARPLDKILSPPPVGKKIRRKYKTIMSGDPMRQPWEDEGARERLMSEVWDELDAKNWLGADEWENDAS